MAGRQSTFFFANFYQKMNPYWIYPQTQLQPVPQYAQQYQPQWQPQPQFQPQNYVQPALLQQPQQLQITGQSVPIMEASVAQSVKSTTTNKPKRPNSRKNQGVVQRQGRRPNRPRNSAAAELKRLQIRSNFCCHFITTLVSTM